ncbi:sulfite exporter TauE/SafE family protein [Alkalithermobacter paradoxus]|uniref:Probable membrane transporter protein n=1 Tax=Alkalithermobacter paradoxus TaxID=29349 RepID=A0A1V4IA36_9FIRM|nr:sulfite exporter TauE/SafE [[Clostridium] thermoalcaliphilum]
MNIKTVLIGFVSGFINGIFGAGGGTLLVPCMTNILEIEEHKSHATAISIILVFTLISSFIYIKNGVFDLKITYKVAIGSIFGGIIGAKLLNKCSAGKLRLIFGIFMIIASIRMVF